MNINQAEWFCAAYEQGSFAKAAETTYVSRQALGKAIKALEAELGVGLFVRNEAGITPTDAAVEIYPRMTRIVSNYHAVVDACDDLNLSSKYAVRIAIANGIMESIPGDTFTRLEHACPGADVRVEKHYYARCMEFLDADKIDFALCAGPVSNPAYDTICVASELLYIGVAQSELAHIPDNCTLEDFSHLVFHTVGDGESGALGLGEAFARHNMDVVLDDSYSEYHNLLAHVAKGGAAALVPESAIPWANNHRLALIPFPGDELKWRVLAVYKPENLSKAQRNVLGFLHEIAVE